MAIVAVAGSSLLHTVDGIISSIGGLFGGSSYAATHAKIVAWEAAISANPALARVPGNDIHKQWIGLRCWAGDQSVVAEYVTVWGDPSASTQGCGCEVDHGCRADAQAAVARLAPLVNTPVGPLNSNPFPTGEKAPTPAGSGPVVSIGVPVPLTTIAASTYGGVPLWLLTFLALVLLWVVVKAAGKK